MLVHQMDAITAFLNGKLDEEIYMLQPTGYVVPSKEHLACKLKKSLYGLKLSPQRWNKAFCEYIESTLDSCEENFAISKGNGESGIEISEIREIRERIIDWIL